MVEGSLNAISPCDCSIIPCSSKEAELIFPNKEADFREAMEEAEDIGGMFCPSCKSVWPLSEWNQGGT